MLKVSDLDITAAAGYDGELDEDNEVSSELHLILEDRGKQWGDTYKVIGKFSGEVLGMPMTKEQFCAFMMLLKLTRYARSNFSERDCLVDIIGYAHLADSDD